MPKTRPPYAPEFRRQMIELVRAGSDPTDLAREFEPSSQAIRNWVAQADREEGRREAKPVTVEMIRHLKIARDTAVKGRTQAIRTLKAIIVCSPAALREPIDQVTGKMTLLRRLAALRPGPLTSTMASAKSSLRAIARRWLALDSEIREHDAHLETLTAARAPDLLRAHGMATGTAAEMLLLVGDNPERIRSEAAFAKMCGACPIPASSGKTNRHQLNRGGNRQANAALYRVVIVRMRGHQPTLDYVRRRIAEGKPRSEIIRCLKRYVACEIYGYLCCSRMSAPPRSQPLDRHRSINAMAESFFSTLECELLARRRFASQAAARMACFSFIEGFYNPVRLHSALGYQSPINYEEQQTKALEAPA